MTDFYMRPLDMKNGAVDLTHGAGGRATAQLINDVFGRHFTNAWLDEGHDGALLPPMNRPVAVSCDGHVVRPLFFPGGDIGRLSVAGTVNDVAMCGARPLYLTASFILEEGFPLKDLDAVVASMAKTCEEAGVAIVTGDTKVVERGHGDGVYIAISGIGEKISEGTISGRAARPGDAVLISGTMGDHGTAILSFREGMSFGTTVESDCAPLNEMVEAPRTSTCGAIRPAEALPPHSTKSPPRATLGSFLRRAPCPCAPKSGAPANSSDSIRYTSPTKAR